MNKKIFVVTALPAIVSNLFLTILAFSKGTFNIMLIGMLVLSVVLVLLGKKIKSEESLCMMELATLFYSLSQISKIYALESVVFEVFFYSVGSLLVVIAVSIGVLCRKA